MPRRFAKSLYHARKGIVYAFRTQRNLRIHMAIGTVAVLMGIALRISFIEFAALIITISLVFITEMLNTALEEVVNLVTLRWRARAMIAKDIAAGAVLVMSLGAVFIGIFIFLGRLVDLVRAAGVIP